MYGPEAGWADCRVTLACCVEEPDGKERVMGDHFKTDIGQLERFLADLESCVDELNEVTFTDPTERASEQDEPRVGSAEAVMRSDFG